METVTVKGKVYQVGEPYRSVDNGSIGYFCSYHKNHGFTLSVLPCMGDDLWECAHLEGFTVGTIEDAPLDLEDGDMCAFEYQNTYCIGFYSKGDDSFVNFGEAICLIRDAIKIAPLVKA